jgi:hypothetical protein
LTTRTSKNKANNSKTKLKKKEEEEEGTQIDFYIQLNRM